MRGSIESVIILQELLPEDDPGLHTATSPYLPVEVPGRQSQTRVTHMCKLNFNGYIPESLTTAHMKSVISTVLELTSFFPSSTTLNASSDNPGSSDDHILDDIAATHLMVTDHGIAPADDAFSSGNAPISNTTFAAFRVLHEASMKAEAEDGGGLGEHLSANEITDDVIAGGDGKQGTVPPETDFSTPAVGSFITWWLKTYPQEFEMMISNSNNLPFSWIDDDSSRSTESVRDNDVENSTAMDLHNAPTITRSEGIRSLVKNSEFQDQQVEEDYSDYAMVSSVNLIQTFIKQIKIICWISCSLFLANAATVLTLKAGECPPAEAAFVLTTALGPAVILFLTSKFQAELKRNRAGKEKPTNLPFNRLSIGSAVVRILVAQAHAAIEHDSEASANLLRLQEEPWGNMDIKDRLFYLCFCSGKITASVLFYLFLGIASQTALKRSKLHILFQAGLITLFVTVSMTCLNPSGGISFFGGTETSATELILSTQMPALDHFPELVLLFWVMHYAMARDNKLRAVFTILHMNFYDKYCHRADVSHSRMKLTADQSEDVNLLLEKLQQEPIRSSLNPKLSSPILFKDIEYYKQIAQDGESLVYAARYRNKIVAVKQISHTFINRRSLSAFLTEMQYMSHLIHPNIIRLVGTVLENPNICMVMEYAREGTLRDYLRTHESLDWHSYKRDFALGIAKGFTYMHARHPPLIHRDLKSTNVLITEWKEVKISDFGTARELDNLELSECLGTKYYMSPEMLNGDKYTTKTDVYSFGSVLADIGMGGHLVSLFVNRTDGPRAIDFNNYITKGWRPSLPQAWAEEMPIIVKLIEACWNPNPDERPSFNKIKKILFNWSGKLSKKMRESPVTRGTSEYTSDDIRRLKDGLSFMQKSSVPPRERFQQMQNWAHVPGSGRDVFVHREATFNFPSWEVTDHLIDWDNPDRIVIQRSLGEVSSEVLHLENEHSKIVQSVIALPLMKPKRLVAKLLWKELKKDYYFCDINPVNKANDPKEFRPYRGANKNKTAAAVLGGGEEEEMDEVWVRMSFTVQGSPDGESCHLTFNATINLAFLSGTGRNSRKEAMAKMIEVIAGNVVNVEKVLKNRKKKKAIEMQKIEERAHRYKKGGGGGGGGGEGGGGEDRRVVVVNNGPIKEGGGGGGGGGVTEDFSNAGDDMPWVSKKAMDQDYRQWRKRGRVMSGTSKGGVTIKPGQKMDNVPRTVNEESSQRSEATSEGESFRSEKVQENERSG